MKKKTMKKLEKKIEDKMKEKDCKKHTNLMNELSLLDIHWF